MCGIVGIIGKNEAAERLIDGLRRLEYRGYDSAGIATVTDNGIQRRRAEGKLKNLEAEVRENPLPGQIGIGHTRWATHGGPTRDNAHPHATDRVAVVHNGIIENYASLKKELQEKQYRFESDTDTEVIAHLVTDNIKQGMSREDAANAAFDRLEGAYAIAMIFNDDENLIIGARQGTPLALGYGDGEMFIASDSYALAPLTQKICFLEDGDRIRVTHDGAVIRAANGNEVEREIRQTAQSGALTGKGKYKHFMLKEIHEQPSVIGDTLNSFINPSTGEIAVDPAILEALDKAPRLTITACGSSYYAGMMGKYWFEQIAGLPVEIDISSEFRYREAPMPKGGAALFISQSGETLDTLEALRYCKSQGQTILSVLNTIESTIERESDHVLRTLAGPEIGVASTKTQQVVLACLALALGIKRGHIDKDKQKEMTDALRRLPKFAADVLSNDDQIKSISKRMAEARDALYLGRGTSFPVAMEGALKLKEISYIHAEGYASGEMKHGPIALIDDNVPVVVIAPHDNLFEKTASNAQEVVARGGKVLIISDKTGVEKMSEYMTWNIDMPAVHNFIAPILYTIPVQLLAYHTAIFKGTDVDQPRNLAKSVTVE